MSNQKQGVDPSGLNLDESPGGEQATADPDDLPVAPGEVLGAMYQGDEQAEIQEGDTAVSETEELGNDTINTEIPPVLEVVSTEEALNHESPEPITWQLNIFGEGCLDCTALVSGATKYKGPKMPCHWSRAEKTGFDRCPGKWIHIQATGEVERIIAKYRKHFSEAASNPFKRMNAFQKLNQDLVDLEPYQIAQVMERLGLSGAMAR